MKWLWKIYKHDPVLGDLDWKPCFADAFDSAVVQELANVTFEWNVAEWVFGVEAVREPNHNYRVHLGPFYVEISE